MKVFIIYACLLMTLLTACKKDMKIIERKWKLEGSDVSLQINADSTYTFTEHNEPRTGNWKMPDENTIIFLDNSAKIKKLTDKELIIMMNDEEMKFTAE